MALNFPDSPSNGQTFTGGGFTWEWDGSFWNKVEEVSVQTFVVPVGNSGSTTFTFDTEFPAGTYTVSSSFGDTSFDVYLVDDSGSNSGYTNTTSIIAQSAFSTVVIYGSTANDTFTFTYTIQPLSDSSGGLDSGAAPFVSSATPSTLATLNDTSTVSGGNFATDIEAKFVGSDEVGRPAKSVVRSSSTELIVTRPDEFPVAAEPYSLVLTNPGITNPSLGNNTLTNYFDAGSSPSWSTSSGSLTPAYVGTAYSVTLSATDPDGGTVSYTIQSGSLPVGLSLNSSTGEISGTTTGSETQSFTVRASDPEGNFTDRGFSITSTVPSFSVQYLVIGGGGGGGAASTGSDVGGAGGGAGGLRYTAATLNAGTTIQVSVGAGGAGAVTNGDRAPQAPDSSFGAFASSGGGGGGSRGNYQNGISGGSGGGGVFGSAAGSGNIGGYNPSEGQNGASPAQAGGGGGGFASAGSAGPGGENPGTGGAGTNTYSAWATATSTGDSGYYAGGGGGGGCNAGNGAAGGIGGGGDGTNRSQASGQPGAANTGGGGGAGGARAASTSQGNGGNGGSGIVIMRYPDSSPQINSIDPGLTYTYHSSGGYKYYAFKQGTGNIVL